jgi:hypothetical protein
MRDCCLSVRSSSWQYLLNISDIVKNISFTRFLCQVVFYGYLLKNSKPSALPGLLIYKQMPCQGPIAFTPASSHRSLIREKIKKP